MEEWRDVPGWEGFYQVSNLGRVRSVDREVSYKNGYTRIWKGVVLNVRIGKDGYRKITLRNKVSVTYRVARLVALAFPEICGKYFEGAQVDHKNTTPTDDRAENLMWVTPSGQHLNPLTKKHKSLSQLNRKDKSKWVIKLSKNNEILHFYPSAAQAARETGLDRSNIRKCCIEGSTAGGYNWKYAE